jgi:hypothetical protein
MSNRRNRLASSPGTTADDPTNPIVLRHGPDCAIAAVATVANLTYDETASAAYTLRKNGLSEINPFAIKELLYHLTGKLWRLEWLLSTRIRVSSMIFDERLSIACITTYGSAEDAHAFAARKRTIYDGFLDAPVSTHEHPLKHWYVGWLIETDRD